MFVQCKKIQAVDVFVCGYSTAQQPMPHSTTGGDVYTIPNSIISDQEPKYNVIQLGTQSPDNTGGIAAVPYDTLYSETPLQKHEYESLDFAQDQAHRQQDVDPQCEYEVL